MASTGTLGYFFPNFPVGTPPIFVVHKGFQLLARPRIDVVYSAEQMRWWRTPPLPIHFDFFYQLRNSHS